MSPPPAEKHSGPSVGIWVCGLCVDRCLGPSGRDEVRPVSGQGLGLGGGHGGVGGSPGGCVSGSSQRVTGAWGLQVELEMAIDTLNPNYCRSKGEQIALNVDGACADETSTYSS